MKLWNPQGAEEMRESEKEKRMDRGCEEHQREQKQKMMMERRKSKIRIESLVGKKPVQMNRTQMDKSYQRCDKEQMETGQRKKHVGRGDKDRRGGGDGPGGTRRPIHQPQELLNPAWSVGSERDFITHHHKLTHSALQTTCSTCSVPLFFWNIVQVLPSGHLFSRTRTHAPLAKCPVDSEAGKCDVDVWFLFFER